MTCIKCDKILCVYNHSDNCTCGMVELMNGKCMEYIELEPLQEESKVYKKYGLIKPKKYKESYFEKILRKYGREKIKSEFGGDKNVNTRRQ